MYSPEVDAKAISDEGDVIKMDLAEAAGHLGQLIEEAAAGKEVVITGRTGRTVRLVPLSSGASERPERQATASSGKTVGHALDRFIGTWTAEEEAELLEAVEVFERVDDSFWT